MSSNTSDSSRRSYYGKNQSQIPFEWEVEPGKPKDPPKEKESVRAPAPAISPPPTMKSQNWVEMPKPAKIRALACFYTNPRKTLKAKKGNKKVAQKQNDSLGQAETSDDDFFSISLTPCDSRSSTTNTAKGSSSSKTLVRRQSSQCINLSKWIRKQFA
ncbi:hypothetical protein L6164_017592 [Bauhinia variegata]|uniref:Uncharacterized protein n=1 Tax=Bauhinia variegata TaxID=167791 RepID=A0ACB9N921_BAUVA|nr:hypothetical protein L6164_017592 [Bauhinia variegata]